MEVDVPDEPGATDVVADPDGAEVEVAEDVPARVVGVGVTVVPVVLGVVVVVERVVGRVGAVVDGAVVVGNIVEVGDVGGGSGIAVVVAIMGAEAALTSNVVRARRTSV
jgi:hypothetical protein